MPATCHTHHPSAHLPLTGSCSLPLLPYLVCTFCGMPTFLLVSFPSLPLPTHLHSLYTVGLPFPVFGFIPTVPFCSCTCRSSLLHSSHTPAFPYLPAPSFSMPLLRWCSARNVLMLRCLALYPHLATAATRSVPAVAWRLLIPLVATASILRLRFRLPSAGLRGCASPLPWVRTRTPDTAHCGACGLVTQHWVTWFVPLPRFFGLPFALYARYHTRLYLGSCIHCLVPGPFPFPCRARPASAKHICRVRIATRCYGCWHRACTPTQLLPPPYPTVYLYAILRPTHRTPPCLPAFANNRLLRYRCGLHTHAQRSVVYAVARYRAALPRGGPLPLPPVPTVDHTFRPYCTAGH